MSFNKFKNNSYCVGGKHYSATTSIRGDITQNKKKTGIPVKLLRGTCTTCKRNKSLIVSDQTINGEGLGEFVKHLGSAAKNVGKKSSITQAVHWKLQQILELQQQVKIQNSLLQLLLIS